MSHSNFETITKFAAVFSLSFICLVLSMDRAIGVYDEGVILTGAMRVNAGDIPHRDFYANYGPAVFFLLSWLFDIFGQSVIVERVFDLVIRAGILTTVYASLNLYCRKTITIFVTVICALWLCFVGQHGYPVYPALLLTLCGSMILLQMLERNTSILYPLIAGLLTGLAALFRYDIGFFAFVAHIFAIILILSQSKYGQNDKAKYIFHKLLPYVLTAGFPVVTVLIWYWSNGVFYSFIHDVISFPGEYYYRTRSLPFPGFFETILHPKQWVIYIPILVICFVAISGFIEKNFHPYKTQSYTPIRDAASHNNRIVFLIFFSLLTAIFYLKGIVRVSPEHMQLALIPSMMILALLMEMSITNTKWFKILVIMLAIISGISAWNTGYKKVISPASLLQIERTEHRNSLVFSDLFEFYKLITNSKISKIDADSIGFPIIRSVSPFFVERNRDAAIRFIVQNTNPDDRIFIGLTRHDKIFINDVSSYFQANRLPATKWHHFDPGLQTSAEIQSKIIADLEQNEPSYIWLESTWDNHVEPNESANSSGIKVLDEYIRRKYKVVQNFGEISVWQPMNL